MRCYLIVGLFLTLQIKGQVLDSLNKRLETIPSDSQKVSVAVTELIPFLEESNRFKEMEVLSKKTYELSKSLHDLPKQVSAGLALSRAYLGQEENQLSEKIVEELISICRNEKYTKGLGNCYKQIARINYYKGDYTKSTQFYLEAQKQWEELNDPKYIALGLGDLAASNYFIGHTDKAVYYWEKEVELYEQLKDEKALGNTLGNLGLAYIDVNNYYKAEISLKKSIAINEKNDSKRSLANAYTNYCKLMYQKNKIEQAIEYNNKAIEIYEEIKDSTYLANNYSNGAELLRTLKHYDEAIILINKAFDIETKRNNQTNIASLLLNRAAIYYDLGRLKEAYADLNRHIEVQDSLINIDNQRNINELEKKYELDQKEKEKKILNQQVELGKAEQSRQRLWLAVVSVFGLALCGVAFVLVRQNRVKQKVNKELSEKNHIIEEQHKDITDSIKYSKRIQTAIMPPAQMWYSILPESFVLFKPKDILSGDFYWIEETDDFILLAAADCTGHGVPGALMSVVNFNLLNKAVLEKGMNDPGDILSAVNIWLTQSLHQSFNESSIKDGMDVALLSINKRTNEIKYAGAFNSVYHFSGDNFNEIKGDKFPVGAFIEESIKKFTTHTINCQKGDMLYIFSDGFADQFGGPKGKKYKYNRLKELLKYIQGHKTSSQEKMMEEEFNEWKGINEQVDDVLVIGLRV